MMSLQDSWQQQRQQRQQFLAQQQQSARQSLMLSHEARRTAAFQQQIQRQSLRQTLAVSNYQRQQASQQTHCARLIEGKTRRQEVQNYLIDISLLRQIRAEELNQELAQNRATRSAVVQALFQDLAGFRAELRQFRSHLSMSVRGSQRL